MNLKVYCLMKRTGMINCSFTGFWAIENAILSSIGKLCGYDRVLELLLKLNCSGGELLIVSLG